jgi:cytochrome P450
MTMLTASMLLDPAVLQDPYCFYATLREHAPVWAMPGTDVVAISTFDLLSEAVARPKDFSATMQCLYRDGNGLPARRDFGEAAMPTLAAADPPVHTTHRRAVFPELVARRMRTLEHDIRALSESAVKQAMGDDGFDFMATIGNIVPTTVVARLIGFRDIDPVQLLEAAFDSTTMVGGTMSMDELNTLVTRTETIEAWIADQIAGTADGGDEGILLAVRRALDAGTLQMGEATIILHTLLSAGGESTTSLLGNAVRMLAEDSRLQRRLREKPQELDVFVEEALRLESPRCCWCCWASPQRVFCARA